LLGTRTAIARRRMLAGARIEIPPGINEATSG